MNLLYNLFKNSFPKIIFKIFLFLISFFFVNISIYLFAKVNAVTTNTSFFNWPAFQEYIKNNLLLSVIFSYFIGKLIEAIINKYLKIGWRIISYESELFNLIKYLHNLTIFDGRLGLFLGDSNTSKLIKALKYRSTLLNDNPIKLIYKKKSFKSKRITQLEQMREKITKNELDETIELIEINSNLPDNFIPIAFVGDRDGQIKIPYYGYLLPRYFRYKKKKYFSGVYSDTLFITNLNEDNYRLLKNYEKMIRQLDEKIK